MLTTRNLALAIFAVLASTVALVPTAGALTLDSTYGSGGTSTPAALPPGETFRFVESVIRSDGSIAILLRNASDKNFRIYSFTANGKPDPVFGPKGFTHGDFSSRYAVKPTGIAAYEDGRLAVVGIRKIRRPESQATLVARFTRNGVQDRTFGKRRGKRAVPAVKIGVRGRTVTPGGIAVDRDNRVVVSYLADFTRLGAIRLKSSGLPDVGYGIKNGKPRNTFSFGPKTLNEAEALAILSDGSTVIGVWSFVSCAGCGRHLYLIKLDPHGVLDQSFGPSTNNPRGYRSVPLEFFGNHFSLQSSSNGGFYSAINTAHLMVLPGTNIGVEPYSPEVRRSFSDGENDPSFSPSAGLFDPMYPVTDPGISQETLYYEGFGVSPGGKVAVCGINARYNNDSPSKPTWPGFIQVFDPVSIAGVLTPPANLIRTPTNPNRIEDCGWQSEDNLLVVDLNRTLTVSRYHP